MNNLMIMSSPTIESREVAEMVEKRHTDLLRDIDTYIRYLENAKLRSQDFFIDSTYKTARNNKTYKCFEVSKKGCEFIAHKLTGQKGVEFTAKYINKFHEMERNFTPSTPEEMIIAQAQSIMVFKHQVETKFEVIEKKVENQITLDHGKQRVLQKSVSKRVINLLGGKHTDDYSLYSKKYFAACYRDIKDRFGVPSYKDVKVKDYEDVINYIANWIAPVTIRES